MDARQIVLAAMAPAEGAYHSPVQVQKLLFLVDREIPKLVGGPFFNFQPYNYGPFDKAVYEVLNKLSTAGEVSIVPQNTWQTYGLTRKGQLEGEEALGSLDESAKTYIANISSFVRSLSFEQLVSAIYQAYPEMKEHSVFQECA